MKSKIVLITGCSTGVGFEAALEFAKAGYKVYATMRNTSKAEKLLAQASLLNKEINILSIDVQDAQSIHNAVEQIMDNDGRIDILVNNAGQGFIKSVEQATEEEIKNLFDINLYGNIRMVKAVIPYMRAQKSGHIIAISSVGGLVGQPMNEIYCASKFALEGFYESMATYMTKYFGIKFTIVEPGGIASEFSNTVLSGIMANGGFADDEYKQVVDAYISAFRKRGASASQTPADVAAIVLSVAENENPPLRIRTSQKAEEFTHLKTVGDPDGTKLCRIVSESLLDSDV